MSAINPEWWVYAVLTLSGFVGCLILNYIVKVINDAKLEDRYIRIRQKASTNQGTQVHSPLAEITRNKRVPLENMLQKPNTTPNKISLVFNKEDNMHENKKKADICDVDSEPAVKLKMSNVTLGKSCDSIAKPTLLGNIYSDIIPDSGKHIVLGQKEEENKIIVDSVSYNNERRSIVNSKTEDYEELKEWIAGLLTKIKTDK